MADKHFFLRLFMLFSLWLPLNSTAQVYKSVNEVPNPKSNGERGYVSDPAKVLQSWEVDSLNEALTRLQNETGVQGAVVIVKNFDENRDDFDFATQLFRTWGIGKKRADNGLLLFITIDRKKYRFITGYGLEGLLPDADLEKIGNTYLVPNFRKKEYGEGIMLSLNTIIAYLKQPVNHKELSALLTKANGIDTGFDWFWDVVPSVLIIAVYWLAGRRMGKQKPQLTKAGDKGNNQYEYWGIVISLILVFTIFFGTIIGFITGLFKHVRFNHTIMVPVLLYVLLAILLLIRYQFLLGALRKKYRDDANFNAALAETQRWVRWCAVVSPLLLIRFIKDKSFIEKDNARFINAPLDAQGQPMTRINRDENKTGTPYLAKGQQAEEKQEVYDYDIWLGANKEVKLVQNKGERFTRFDICPKCGFHTLGSPENITLVAATKRHEGKTKKVRLCKFCEFEEFISESIIPIVAASSSSSSSSSSGSGSSSSSSDSGSWGGGSTGGGGSGGSW